jgi:hypothetical protein
VVKLQNFNGEQLEVVEVYFMYDLDEPVIVSPPIEPGYVTFWTNKPGFLGKEMLIGDVLYDGVTEKLKDKPDCGAAGARTLILKPGHYSFRALKTGNDHEGAF